MSTIDEVLAAAEVVDAVCVIDGETRIISVPTEYKELGVESDEKVTRVKFQCPKIVGDNIDLTEYNLYINYKNASNKLNSYLVEDATVTGDTINFSWLLSRHVTESPGTINYIVCAKKADDTGVINEWNTKVATGIVGIGLEATEEIEEQNIDAIEQILRSIVELENKVDSGGSGGSGGYYAPSVDDDGNLTWTASKTDMPAVDGANIKGPQGKSAYAYAVEGGFTGTEAAFAAKLAAEKFANPNALTFTGAVTGSYDGSAPLSVEIPRGTINVKDFGAAGDGTTDDTTAIQEAIDTAEMSGIAMVYFPRGTYKVSADKADNNFYAALNVHSGQHLIFESATFQLTANGYDFYAVLNIHNVSNVTVEGGLTIIGDREIHTGTTGESGHGIRIVNSKNVHISDVNIRYTWGDGVCVGGNGTMEEISENVTLERIRTYKCSRNGLSIIESNGVVVRDCDFTYTDRTAPQYGIDVEPNLGTATNITIENVRMLNNGIGGFALYSTKATMPGVLTLRNIETDAKTIIYTSSAAGGIFDVCVDGWRHTQKSGETNPTLRLSGKGNLRISQLYVINKSANRVIIPLDIENLRMDGVTVEDDPAVSTKGTLSISGSADTSIGKAVITAFLSRNPAEVTWYSGNHLSVDNLQDTVVNLNEHLTTGGSSESYKLLLCDKALVLGTALSAKARVFIQYTYGNVNPFRVVNTTSTEVQLYTTVSAGITFVGDVPGGSSVNSAVLTGNASYEITPMLYNGLVYVRKLNTRVPANTSEINNDSGYQTAEQVSAAITAAVGAAMEASY